MSSNFYGCFCGKTNRRFSTMATHQLNHRLLCMSFLIKNKTIITPKPPYSPGLAPADFFLFPKLKISLKGNRFATIEVRSGRSGSSDVKQSSLEPRWTQSLYWPSSAKIREEGQDGQRKGCTMIEQVKGKSKQGLLAIPKSMLQKYFRDWKKFWHKCLYRT